MTGKKKKQWTLIAASITTLAAFWYLLETIFLNASFLRILPALLFGTSAALYWYRYKTEVFEDD